MNNDSQKGLYIKDIKNVLEELDLKIVDMESEFQNEDYINKISKEYGIENKSTAEHGLNLYKLELGEKEPDVYNEVIEIWLPNANEEYGANPDPSEDEDLDSRLETIEKYEFPVAIIVSKGIEEYLKDTPELFKDSEFKEMEEANMLKVLATYRSIINRDELTSESISDMTNIRYMKVVDLRANGLELLGKSIDEFNDWMASVGIMSEKLVSAKSNLVNQIRPIS